MSFELITEPDVAIAALRSISLTKWPQMLVWGTPVTPAQAAEIILRTDDFLTSLYEHSGGNNHRWNQWAKKELGLSLFKDFTTKHPELNVDWTFRNRVEAIIREKVGTIYTQYVSNSWASCAFIYGPHGWVHPDGNIGFIDNVGKWPEAVEVYEEWTALAQAFPYLELHATLMSEEETDADVAFPLVTFVVANGKVQIAEEPFAPAHDVMPRRKPADFINSWGNPSREQGLSDQHIIEFGKVLKPIVEGAIDTAYAEKMALTAEAAKPALPAA